jgi:hypothetical protein
MVMFSQKRIGTRLMISMRCSAMTRMATKKRMKMRTLMMT